MEFIIRINLTSLLMMLQMGGFIIMVATKAILQLMTGSQNLMIVI